MADGRILIIDDDVFVRKSLRRTLMQYDVTLVEDGARAVELVEGGEEFDVILCDLMMPGMGGMEVYEHFKAHVPGHEQRMVFLTGGAVDGRASVFLQSVVNPVLEKPFDFQRLRETVAKLLEAAQVRTGD